MNSLSSYDYNIGGSGLTLYSFDLGMLNAGDMVNIGLQLDHCKLPETYSERGLHGECAGDELCQLAP